MRDILKDIAKSMKESVTASIVNAGGSASSSNAPTGISSRSKEDKNEAQRSEDETKDLLRTIAKNTTPKVTNTRPKKPIASILIKKLTTEIDEKP